MTVVQDEGICLRWSSYAETSQIVTLFTREHGRVRAIVKGAKRAKGRFSGGLDLLQRGQVQFAAPGGEGSLSSLRSFELEEAFAGLRGGLARLHAAEYGAYLTAAFTEDYDPHPSLYEALGDFLRGLERGEREAALLAGYELRVLEEAGLMPVWEKCAGCGGKLDTQRAIYFSSQLGGTACGGCEGALMDKFEVKRGALALLQEPERLAEATSRDLLAARDVLARHERELLGKEPRIMSYVNEVLWKQEAKGG